MGDYGDYEDNGGYGDYGGGAYDTTAQNASSGGGGFMMGNNMSTTTPTRGAGGKGKADTVVPLTVRRIVSLQVGGGNESIMLDGQELGKVCLVGRVASKESKNVQVAYTVDDGTGSIQVTQWINEGEDSTVAQEARDSILENTYVKVFGQVRVFNNKLTVSAFAIRRIEDFNEVTHHFLNVIYSHLSLTKGSLNPALQKGQFNNPVGDMNPAFQQAVGESKDDMNASGSEFTNVQMMVLRAFKENDESEEGTNVNQVIQKLAASSINADQVRRAVNDLQDEGHLYSTVDENHFKTTVDD